MIRSHPYVPVRQNGEELMDHALAPFDFVANAEDIHAYLADQIPAHWHRELEVFYLVSGKTRIGAGDQVYDLSAGEGCAINSGVLHSFLALADEPCRFRSFVFDASIIAGAPGSAFDTRYVRPFLASGAAFTRFERGEDAFFEAFSAAFSACKAEEAGYEFTIRDSLSKILILTMRKMPSDAEAAPSQQEERIKRMIEWIDGHLECAVSVSEIARAAHVCPRVCQRLFKRYLHCRPMEYWMQRRVLAAARTLAETDEPITSIAMRYAFANPSHFTREFHKTTGCTPTEYRAQGKRE